MGDLKNSDKIMNSTYWIGLHPQINEEHIEYMFDITKKFFKRLEKQINDDPNNYLWSHNRWKHKK